jgi:hypothetical protein
MRHYDYQGDNPGATPASEHLIREARRELSLGLKIVGPYLTRTALNELKALMRLKFREAELHGRVYELEQRVEELFDERASAARSGGEPGDAPRT